MFVQVRVFQKVIFLGARRDMQYFPPRTGGRQTPELRKRSGAENPDVMALGNG